MTRLILGLALGCSLAACAGSPYGTVAVAPVDGSDGGVNVPAALSNDLDGYAFDPGSQTLTIRGISLEDGPFQEVYQRRPGLDRAGYLAFTAQDGSLDRHSTAYVRDIRGTQAVVAVTGGQFEYFFAGAGYTNNGDFTAPTPPAGQGQGGLVTYAGTYVGLLNFEGSEEDLLPVTPGTAEQFIPLQAAEIAGNMLINASFADGAVNGIIIDRTLTDYPGVDVADLVLVPTDIAADGSFSGAVETSPPPGSGTYGGIFGGNGATEVAGAVNVTEHIGSGSEEFGIFVIAQCGTEGATAVCDQPVP